MDKLNFYTVDLDYIQHLKTCEQEKRGFTRVPNMEYGKKDKQKFVFGVVLQVNKVDYYVPVTSFKEKKPDNFLIRADNGNVVSSLRFNYMIPVPKALVQVRSIKDEPDRAYRALLSQELRYCIKNKDMIQQLAERTYKRVGLGKDKGLVKNSCAFTYLEQKCVEYQIMAEDPSRSTPAADQIRGTAAAEDPGTARATPGGTQSQALAADQSRGTAAAEDPGTAGATPGGTQSQAPAADQSRGTAAAEDPTTTIHKIDAKIEVYKKGVEELTKLKKTIISQQQSQNLDKKIKEMQDKPKQAEQKNNGRKEKEPTQ